MRGSHPDVPRSSLDAFDCLWVSSTVLRWLLATRAHPSGELWAPNVDGVAANIPGSTAAGVGIAFLIILYVVAIVGSLTMLVVALVDIVRRPDWQWRLAGQEKVLWILLVVLVNFLAIPSLIYWFNIRKKLIAVEQAAAAGHLGPGFMTYSGWQPNPYPSYTAPPPGWHPDPSGQYRLRWWDGAHWSEHTSNDAPGVPNEGQPAG
jgi:hypothetical protein